VGRNLPDLQATGWQVIEIPPNYYPLSYRQHHFFWQQSVGYIYGFLDVE